MSAAHCKPAFRLVSDLNPNKPVAVLIVDGVAHSLANDVPVAILSRFADEASREMLIRFARWNDRNGCFTDSECRRELGRVLKTSELRIIVWDMLREHN